MSTAWDRDAVSDRRLGRETFGAGGAGTAARRFDSGPAAEPRYGGGTICSIVRKILTATPFPLEVTEVEKGGDAIELASQAEFDIVFLDYNMPGFSGLETIAGFRRRAKKQWMFVLMASTQDETLVMRAPAQGATFLKETVFPGPRALNSRRT